MDRSTCLYYDLLTRDRKGFGSLSGFIQRLKGQAKFSIQLFRIVRKCLSAFQAETGFRKFFPCVSPVHRTWQQNNSQHMPDATSAISSSSVDTTMLAKTSDFLVAARTWPINGNPPRSTIFLRGMPFDPPRAGMTARRRFRFRPPQSY